MISWGLINGVLSALALGFAYANALSPHRLRFHVCLLALLAWLVPWSLVGGWMPDLLSLDLWQVEQRMVAGTAAATNIPLMVIDTSALPLANDMTLLHLPLLLLLALLSTGALRFVWAIGHHQLRLRALWQDSEDASYCLRECGIASEVNVRRQNHIKGAFSSGVLRPMIWVHSSLLQSKELPTLLQHELTHIQQHDNAYLVFITLVEKLFWWNPLVGFLGRRTRHLQELSCDEHCQRSNADYPVQLAQLMLANTGLSPSMASEELQLSANMFNKSAINVQRLKELQRSHQMQPRHIVSAIATGVIAITTVGLVTAQPAAAPAGERTMVFVAGEAAAGGPIGVAPDAAMVAGEQVNMVFSMHGAPGANQMIKLSKNGDETQVTFNFTNATLPQVLGPLANTLGYPAPALTAKGAAIARQVIITSDDAVATNGGVVFSPAVGVDTLEVETAIAAATANGTPHVVIKRLEPGMATTNFEWPVSPNLVIEDEAARTRQVTVAGENLSLSDAIAAIAKAANCNIFKDGDNIVVDYCAKQ